MASETGKGVFGRKGAGKTHELVRIALIKLREGRRVTLCIPQVDVDKVSKYLNDETIRDRLNVCSYEALEEPNFFPNEKILTKLMLWRRFDIDYKKQEPDINSPKNPIPDDAWRWRDSVFWPGDVLIIDEAWRVMRTEQTCPPGLRTALHMARHWRGPADWRNPEDVKKYLSPTWFPGLGGPEYAEITEKYTDENGKEKTRKVERYLGGDGTQMVTCNLVISSQRFQGLAKNLREQIDESTLLVAINKRNLPKSIKGIVTDKEQYLAYTFESEQVPSWTELDRSVKKGEKIWIGEQVIDHDDEIHELYQYTDGYAREDSADNKASFKNSPAYKKMRNISIAAIIMIVIALGGAYYALSLLKSPDDFVMSTASGVNGGSSVSTGQSIVADPSNLNSVHGSVPSFGGLTFSGRVGQYSSIKNVEKYVYSNEISKIIVMNGIEIDTQKDFSGGDSYSRSNSGSGSLQGNNNGASSRPGGAGTIGIGNTSDGAVRTDSGI